MKREDEDFNKGEIERGLQALILGGVGKYPAATKCVFWVVVLCVLAAVMFGMIAVLE